MQVWSSRGARATFVADNLALCHILTNPDNETFHVAIDSSDIAPMVNFACPTQARHIPTRPDHLAAVSCHDGIPKGGTKPAAVVWPPASTPQLLPHMLDRLR